VGALRLALAAVLVPLGFVTFGLVGTVAAYVVTQWVAKSLLLVAGARRLGVRAIDMLPWGDLRAWLGRAAAVYVAITVLRLAGPWHGVWFLAAASVSALLVWVASLLVGGGWRWREAHG
jgi:hypothetical protein